MIQSVIRRAGHLTSLAARFVVFRAISHVEMAFVSVLAGENSTLLATLLITFTEAVSYLEPVRRDTIGNIVGGILLFGGIHNPFIALMAQSFG